MSETTEQYTEQGFEGYEAERTADSLTVADLGKTVRIKEVRGFTVEGYLTGFRINGDVVRTMGRREPLRLDVRVSVELNAESDFDVTPGSVVRFP